MIFPMVGGAVPGFDLLGKRSLVTLVDPSRYVGTCAEKTVSACPDFCRTFDRGVPLARKAVMTPVNNSFIGDGNMAHAEEDIR
jgi:hypothetical protein